MKPKKTHDWQRMSEFFMTLMGFVGSLATIPTLTKVWITHPVHAGGQSIITWSCYALIALLWLMYGIYNQRIAIWSTNLIYLALYLAIVTGIITHAGITW